MNSVVFLLLGTNLGDRNKNLAAAQHAVEASVGHIRKMSSIYQTAAWGNTQQPDFLNQVLEVETRWAAETVLYEILSIEKRMGRTRLVKWGERIIDIDILLFDELIMTTAHLTIPHPELPNRRFALAPLAEIAGDLIHPLYKLTIGEMLERCTDQLDVQRLTA